MSTTEQEQGDIFGPEHHGALIRNAPEIHETLRQFIQKCWYTDELLVVDQPLEKNQELFYDWISQELGEEFEIVRVTADMLMTAEELLQQVLEEFDLECEDEEYAATLLQALNSGALGERERPTELLIQVENAHELGEGVLTELLTLVAAHEDRLTPHIALWGDMRQTDALHSLGSDERARVALLRLAPFKPEEIAAYLAYCWEQFEPESELPFGRAQVEALLEESGGAIDELDELALDLLEGEDEGWQPPKWHILALVVLVAALLIIFLSRGGDEAEAEVENNGRRVVTLELPSASSTSDSVSDSSSQQQEVDAVSPSVDAVAAEPDAEPEPEPEAAVVEVTEAAEPPAVVDADTAPIEEPAAEELVQEPAVEQVVEQTVVESAVATPEQSVPAASQSEEVSQSDALLSHRDGDIFLQLMGSFSESAAQQFMVDNQRIEGKDNRLYQFESRYQDKPWYVVVFGPFSSRGQAEEAREALPRHLLQGDPWPRSMADIRQAAVD